MARFNTLKAPFASDDRGSVTFIFALLMLVVVLAAGAGIDYARMLHARFNLAAAADAAALAAGRALGEGTRTDSEIKQLAEAYFRANLAEGHDFGSIGDLSVAIDRETGRVTVDAAVNVPMTLTRVAGFRDVEIPVAAESISGQHEIELAMVLDVTGSMGSPASKIADLRHAANGLVEQLLPDDGRPSRVRVALAPYAASVNAGGVFTAATGRRTGTGCVFERGGAARFREDAPSSGTYFGYDKDVACPSAAVQPLTSSKRTLTAQIDKLRASGQTAGHIGTAWGWYLLSPKWASIWPNDSRPEAYQPSKIIKAVLLMTDGEFNTQYVSGNGASATQARSLCTNMKDEGIIVYSVGFMAGSAAERLLKDCATSPAHYFPASNGDALKTAFNAIGQSLSNLHLSQ
ncbi:vWA domain-containing protein [Hyphomicrobium sp.]|uniref:vWA domain-containing protein n=1 Tax=Hyphomicrobium sp. TaxID=82 RepID=UPI003F718ABF